MTATPTTTTALTDLSAEDEAIASTEKAMRDAGVPTEDHLTEDYFAFDQTHRVRLPDGKQWVEHKELTEGERRKYLNSVSRDVVVQRATGDARMRMAPGDERYALLKVAIVDWQLFRGGQPLPFSPQNLEKFLEQAPPRVIDLIEKEVRKANPWLMAELSVEDMIKERDELNELIEKKQQEEEGK